MHGLDDGMIDLLQLRNSMRPYAAALQQ